MIAVLHDTDTEGKKYFSQKTDGQSIEGQEGIAEQLYIAPSACIGMVWPPFAAPGENVCHRSLNRTSEEGHQNAYLMHICKYAYREVGRHTCIAGTSLHNGGIR